MITYRLLAPALARQLTAGEKAIVMTPMTPVVGESPSTVTWSQPSLRPIAPHCRIENADAIPQDNSVVSVARSTGSTEIVALALNEAEFDVIVGLATWTVVTKNTTVHETQYSRLSRTSARTLNERISFLGSSHTLDRDEVVRRGPQICKPNPPRSMPLTHLPHAGATRSCNSWGQAIGKIRCQV